jgi:hypothetical protein
MKKLLTFCRLAYLTHFSRPASDRVVYRTIRRIAASRILEIGMQQGLRSSRMIEVARKQRTDGVVHYTGIDLFELSSSVPQLSLKAAHCRLQPTGARIRLVPGDPFSALASAANHIGPCDLIVIAASQDFESLGRAWFYVPRLLHASTQVYVERPGDGDHLPRFELLGHDEIRRRAQTSPRRTAA